MVRAASRKGLLIYGQLLPWPPAMHHGGGGRVPTFSNGGSSSNLRTFVVTSPMVKDSTKKEHDKIV